MEASQIGAHLDGMPPLDPRYRVGVLKSISRILDWGEVDARRDVADAGNGHVD